ncbi:MAG: hypothetical protein AAGC55_31815, partial [Myxococcota bacterium]
QLERLGALQTIAEVAAVVGREFCVGHLAAVVDLPAATVEDAMAQLSAAQLVSRSQSAGEWSYRFCDALLHKAAYEALPEAVRRSYHLRVASALEGRFPEWVTRHPERLVHHLFCAGEIARGMEYVHSAGCDALHSGRPEVALAQLAAVQHRLACVSEPALRAEYELELYALAVPAVIASHGSGSAQMSELVERAEGLLRQLGDRGGERFPVLYGQFVHHIAHGNYERARAIARGYVAAAQRSGDRGSELIGLSILGSAEFRVGRFGDAEASLRQALELRDTGDICSLRSLHGFDPNVHNKALLAVLSWILGKPDTAVRLSEEALAAARDLDHTPSLLHALYCAVQVRLFRNEARAMRDLLDEWVSAARNAGPAIDEYSDFLHGWGSNDPRVVAL